ncbi:MAG: urease accessory protein UreD [Hyphomicrobiales bacterium]|nr:urease accessory protein UreD [Hyphomicrobiales bacterium]
MSARFEHSKDKCTRVAFLEEGGGYRMRLMGARRAATRHGGAPCEGGIVNTGGGMAGGDHLSIEIEAGERADIILSTPAAERIYRSSGPDTLIHVALQLKARSRLAWMPQETILFRGARLTRHFDVNMDASATLIISEATVFGRLAMGETPGLGLFSDRWRIRRDDRLLHAEDTRLDGDIGRLLARPALGNGARAIATVLMASPEAEDRLDAVRRTLVESSRCEGGASAWNGMLIGRFIAKNPVDLRVALVRFLLVMLEGKLPRLWTFGDGASR